MGLSHEGRLSVEGFGGSVLDSCGDGLRFDACLAFIMDGSQGGLCGSLPYGRG